MSYHLPFLQENTMYFQNTYKVVLSATAYIHDIVLGRYTTYQLMTKRIHLALRSDTA